MMVTFSFSNDEGVLIHYKTDMLDEKRDNFNVYEIVDHSWKFRKVYDLATRNNIPRRGRELNMIVYVGQDGKYYQLTNNPKSDYTENTDWTEYLDGADFEAAIPLRPQFRLIEYTVKGFEKFAQDWDFNLDMYLKKEIINLYTA